MSSSDPAISEMPPPSSARPLALIVAATSPHLGIGRNGSLPWRLKAEMAYFARVTKRVPSTSSNTTTNASSTSSSARNAVIMGRRTWESIPPKFRPLKDRLNVVVSRSGQVDGVSHDGQNTTDVMVATGLEDAVGKITEVEKTKGDASSDTRAFVIGGSSIYKAALELEQTKRVLLTKVYGEFECDTFFPVDLEGEEGKRLGWKKVGQQGLEAYIGEHVEGVVKEGSTEFEYCLFERIETIDTRQFYVVPSWNGGLAGTKLAVAAVTAAYHFQQPHLRRQTRRNKPQGSRGQLDESAQLQEDYFELIMAYAALDQSYSAEWC